MPDSRQRLKDRYSYMTPAQWQAAQVEAMKSREDEEPPAKRQRVLERNAKDFQTPYASKADVEKWFDEYPELGKRNFYIVHNHWATKKHHDLRIHLDGETISWAIPRELTNPAAQLNRYAVETIPHSIAYCLYEGPTVGTVDKPTGVWDIGTYKIFETKNKADKKAQLRAQGLDDAETTDEEETPEAEDVKQERLFREAYAYASFRPVPATANRPALPAKQDSGRKRAFVIELNGKRWNGLRLTFTRDSSDFGYTKPKGAPDDWRALERHAHWIVRFGSSPSVPLAATESRVLAPDRSLLSGRTMDEIRTDSIALLEASGALRGDAGAAGSVVDREVRRRLVEWMEKERDEFTQADLQYLKEEAKLEEKSDQETETV
ncbi:hypothetical protein JCM10449v2_006525 [Rhodotorula kratochvilovae]